MNVRPTTAFPPRTSGASSRVERYIPRADGAFDRADTLADARCALRADGLQAWVRAGRLEVRGDDGTPRFEAAVPAGETPRQLELHQRRLYLQTDAAIRAFDPQGGKLIGERPCGPHDKLAFLDDGICCATPDPNDRYKPARMTFLSPDLAERAQRTTDGPLDKLLPLAGGRVAIVSGGGWPTFLQIASAQESAPARQIAWGSAQPDAEGRLYFVEKPQREAGAPSWQEPDPRIMRFDPTSGVTAEVKGTHAAEAVVPFRDGRYLVVHKYRDTPRLILFGRDGVQRRHFLLGDGEQRRHDFERFVLSPDQQHAWVLVDRDGDKHERVLFRLDLRAPEGPLPSQADQDRGTPLYARPINEPFVPVVLEDGRVAIFREGRVELLSDDGRPLPVSDAEAMRAALDGKSLAPSALGSRGSLDDPLTEALGRFSYPWTSARPSDTIEVRERIPETEALQALGLPDRTALDSAAAGRQLLDHTFGGARPLPCPPDFPGHARASRASIEGDYDGKAFTLPARPPAEHVSAAVFATEDAKRAWIVAGGSDGTVTVHDLQTSATERHLLGRPAVSFAPAALGRIRAVADDGTALVVALAPGQPLRAGEAGPPPSILVEPDTVRIGGVVLPRNRR